MLICAAHTAALWVTDDSDGRGPALAGSGRRSSVTVAAGGLRVCP